MPKFRRISEYYYKLVMKDFTLIIIKYGNMAFIGIRKDGYFNYRYGEKTFSSIREAQLYLQDHYTGIQI